MTVNLITGSAGTPHISGDDLGHQLAGIVGSQSYVLKTGSQLKASMASANSVTVADGDAIHHGRHFRLDSPETVTIESGTQGQKRNDLVCLRYARTTNASGRTVETGSVAVLKGTPTTGTAADPTVPAGNVLEGAAEDWMPLYRVSLDGITASAPVALFDVLTPAAEVWDSVSQRPRVYHGSTVFKANGTNLNISARSLGLDFDTGGTDSLILNNGEYDAGQYVLLPPHYIGGSFGAWVAVFRDPTTLAPKSVVVNVRINWVYVRNAG